VIVVRVFLRSSSSSSSKSPSLVVLVVSRLFCVWLCVFVCVYAHACVCMCNLFVSKHTHTHTHVNAHHSHVRHATAHLRPEDGQVAEEPELGRQAPPQLVLGHVELLERRQPAQRGRQRRGQPVALQLQVR
jgi:hypothetical protein